MAVKYTIHYHEKVVKIDIPKLSRKSKSIIKKSIEEKLQNHPEIFGKPLRTSLKGYRKLRVGNYRVIFCIEKTKVKILAIQHRSIVYTVLNSRL